MFPRSSVKVKLNEEILAALKKLEDLDPNTEEYGSILETISRLQKLKTEESLKPPSMDTVLIVGANIFGILWLTRYERERVIASKALGFVMKPR
jgi:hypothetical protein